MMDPQVRFKELGRSLFDFLSQHLTTPTVDDVRQWFDRQRALTTEDRQSVFSYAISEATGNLIEAEAQGADEDTKWHALHLVSLLAHFAYLEWVPAAC